MVRSELTNRGPDWAFVGAGISTAIITRSRLRNCSVSLGNVMEFTSPDCCAALSLGIGKATFRREFLKAVSASLLCSWPICT